MNLGERRFPEAQYPYASNENILTDRSDPAVRIIQVSEMMTLLKRTSTPSLLLGDMNARPDAPELAPLHEVGYDTWFQVHKDDPGFTFPADKPDRKIDYIMASHDIQTISAEIIQTQASDHYPIVADLNGQR